MKLSTLELRGLNVKSLASRILPLFIVLALVTSEVKAQSAVALSFRNPVLISGTAKQNNAKYRFSNVATGIDALVTIKGRSAANIVISSIDSMQIGWDKAFQPVLGMVGSAPANQNWWVEFKMEFVNAGTNTKKTITKFVATGLDIDGDGRTTREWVEMKKIKKLTLSATNFLNITNEALLPGVLVTCAKCALPSVLVNCSKCNGSGVTNSGSGNNNPCDKCKGSGKVHLLCGHDWDGRADYKVVGPVTNFTSIDTGGTAVMATYEYENSNSIEFLVGATTGNLSSTTTGAMRLNSIWFKEFNMAPQGFAALPVKLIDFAAKYDNNKVNLTWATGEEIRFDHFMVERSTDGQNFNDIGVVFSAGSSDSRQDYALLDANLANRGGLLYYRLRMVDADKNISFSAVRIIRLGEQKPTITLTAYPNPVVNDLRVTIPSAWQGKQVRFEVVNGNGQSVKIQKNINASQTEVISVAQLGRGIYFVKATTGTETAQQRIIKN